MKEEIKETNVRILPSTEDGEPPTPILVTSTIPHNRGNLLRWDGWGYKDSGFANDRGDYIFTGDRYPICNNALPYFLKYVRDRYGLGPEDYHGEQPTEIPADYKYPPSKLSAHQLQELETLRVRMSTDGADRLFHAHGQALHEIINVRKNTIERYPDIVVWPDGHDKVVEIVELAGRLDVVVIPFGGGTTVSGSIECPPHEGRPILSLDMSGMNRILWIDRESLVVCCEAGIIGQDLDRELKKKGYTTGHEPDSAEFSTLGGWVATRASGMLKNTYGNIEDILVHVRMVSPRGVLENGCRVPRMSCGPDFNNIVLGSEGCLGVITEVAIKIRPLPPYTRYGSFVFPDFESGVRCLREIARQRVQPSSIRLMDNEQYQLGMALRVAPSRMGVILQGLQMLYITRIKGFDATKMCLATLLYVGEKEDVLSHERKLNKIALHFGAVPAGEKNGERGYLMTYIIAYIRDLALYFDILGETLETSVPWDRALRLVRHVKRTIARECELLHVSYFSTMCRLTQTYDSGCCIYFYFIFNSRGCEDPLKITHHLEARARDEIIALGGSISHHHGVGKLRKKWYEQTVSTTGKHILRAIKEEVDPKNIFGSFNLTDTLPRQSKL